MEFALHRPEHHGDPRQYQEHNQAEDGDAPGDDAPGDLYAHAGRLFLYQGRIAGDMVHDQFRAPDQHRKNGMYHAVPRRRVRA